MSVNGLFRPVCLVFALLLGGCAEHGDNPADLYALSVARVLDRQVSRELEALPVYPARRALKIPLERLDISVLDFARLHTCDMGGLIGARNSSLGRLQQPSQRLAYELKWLAAAQDCISAGQIWLQPIYVEKQTRLSAVVWNATFASSEMATLMGSTSAPMQAAQANLVMRNLADLVRAVANESEQADVAPLDAILKQGADSLRIGSQRAAWVQLRATLMGVAQALRQRQPPVCLSGAPNVRSERLLNVFRRYYVRGWQPAIAAEMSGDRGWIMALAALVDALRDTAPPAFLSWYDTTLNPRVVDSEWRRTQAAVVDHAAAWQDFLKQCGVDVTALREV